MSREEIFENLENWSLGVDDTFQFHCTQCGKCCVTREDILLNPRDMYRISKFLKITPHELLEKHCETYIGGDSRMPIIRLKPIGKTKRCPFLTDSKCSIQEAKPAVCAIYPLGRFTKHDPETDEMDSTDGMSVHYFLQPITCGDTSETHTVREWLKGFDFEIEDKAHIIWTNFITRSSRLVKGFEEKLGFEKVVPLWNAILVAAYLAYKPDEEFLPQFEKNISSLGQLYDKLELMMNLPMAAEPPEETEGEDADGQK